MNKEIYMTPEMEITVFEAEDIVTASNEGFDQEAGEVSLFDLKF